MRYSLLGISVALAILSIPAQAVEFHPVIGVQSTQIDGFLQSNGDRVDLRSDLGLNRSSKVFAGIDVGSGAHSLALRYIPYHFEGDSTASRGFTFNGVGFTLSDSLHSTLDMTEYSADYRYRLFRTPVLNIGVGAGLTVFDATADVKSQSNLNNAHKQLTVPVPTVGISATASLPLTGLAVTGDLSGIGTSANNRYINADIAAQFSPLPLAGVKAGYHYRELRVDASNTLGNIKLSGPYATLFVGF